MLSRCGIIAKMSAQRSHLSPAQVFGRRLRETRERRGWKQGELADRLRIDRTTLNKIENGTRGDVRLSQLFQFARALDIAPVNLLTPRLDDVDLVVTPGSKPMRPSEARKWIRGESVIGRPDPVGYLLDLPQDEQRLLLEELLSEGLTPLTRGLMAGEIEKRAADILEELEAVQQTAERRPRRKRARKESK
jgi:putative transcriptional regulator